ncbi:MAG TPA: ATP-binding protein [Puia sp.]|nr:ATP-binding protein [Puia sp.]
MFKRLLENTLRSDLQRMPAVALSGPRQVGKTTLVKQIAAENAENFVYLDLESPADLAKLQDAELFLDNYKDKTVVIDEIQHLPSLFPILRSLIDKERRPGRFLLLGSASPELVKQSAESLAGRIRYRELFPFNLVECGNDALNSLWYRGGFPQAFLANNDRDAMEWMSDFVNSYVTRDLAQLGLSMPSTQILRLLQMIAHSHGQLVNYSNLSRSLGISQPTITNALYYLEESMLIRTLQPWHFNSKKRLVKTPKVYIRDSGMLHNLLFLPDYNQLMGHPQAGNSWEGFVIQQILSILPKNRQTWFYRTQDGAETDLLISEGNTITHAVEIKLTNSPQISRGNTQSLLDLESRQAFVITPGSDTYTIKDWQAIKLGDFLPQLNESAARE